MRWSGNRAMVALIAATVALKVAILLTSQRWADADESVIGVMALHILHMGARPIYFWGQNYGGGGAIEAYLAAPLFGLFGSSSIVLKLVPALIFVATSILLFVMARPLYGETVALASTALFAFGSPLAQWFAKARGGYAETVPDSINPVHRIETEREPRAIALAFIGPRLGDGIRILQPGADRTTPGCGGCLSPLVPGAKSIRRDDRDDVAGFPDRNPAVYNLQYRQRRRKLQIHHRSGSVGGPWRGPPDAGLDEVVSSAVSGRQHRSVSAELTGLRLHRGNTLRRTGALCLRDCDWQTREEEQPHRSAIGLAPRDLDRVRLIVSTNRLEPEVLSSSLSHPRAADGRRLVAPSLRSRSRSKRPAFACPGSFAEGSSRWVSAPISPAFELQPQRMSYGSRTGASSTSKSRVIPSPK